MIILRFFPRERVSEKFLIVGMAAIYRKDYLFKILRKHENVWEFEYYASIRSKRFKEKVLQYNNKNPEIFVYNDEEESGLGIKYGKWLPRNHELFEKYGISVNFDNLGVYYGEEHNESNKETPALCDDNNSSIFPRLKKKQKKILKNVQKRIQEYRSLK